MLIGTNMWVGDRLGSLSRQNFRDALRRVAMIIRQHIIKIERRFESKTLRHDDGLFLESMRTSFSEEAFVTCPLYTSAAADE